MITEKTVTKTLVRQQDQTDCGVACLLSLIRYYGGDDKLEKLRRASGTTRQGTTLLGLYQAANDLGFTAEGCEADLPALIAHGSPVILHVVLENRLQHYIICYGYHNGLFTIGDPSKGMVHYTKSELEAIWKSKTCLTLAPNERFVKTTMAKKSKKVWFLNLLKEDHTLLGISIGLGVGVALLGMAMAIFSQKLIDDILPSKDINRLITGIALLTFLLLVRVGLGSLREFFLIRQSKDFNNRIIANFYGSLLYLPKSFFDTRKIGELVARLNDTNRIQRVIKHVASNFVIDILVSLVSLGFLYYYSWQTGIIATISLPIYFFLIYSFNNRIIRAQKEVMQSYAHSESNYISSMSGIAEIKNNNRQPLFQKINQLIYGNFQKKVFALGKINIRIGLWGGLAGVVFLISILGFTSYQVFNETMQLGELMAILGIAGSLLPAVTNLALIAIPINEAKIAFDRMYEFVSIEKERSGPEQLDGFDSLQLKEVAFRFTGRSQLLKSIDLEVHKNELVAIVGESGSGKSTLGQLVQKFLTYESGAMTVNGAHDLKEIDLQHWRNCIGVVSQDITIFPGTVLDNIVLGAEDSPENVVAFCQEYGFEPFIAQLPQGYATLLGEEGINLSGGQKQIIALARALYKKPQLLILDEATSAMDRNTEQFTLHLLERLKKEMAIFFISHRLHILKNTADRIYVLENGRITEKGNHKELMETDNFYSEYWKNLLEPRLLATKET